MRIAVIGATGRTGQQVVRHALERGAEVTAVVRNPQKLSPEWSSHSRFRAAVADARDVEALTRALKHQDGVALCLGAAAGEGHAVHREGVDACLTAMATAGVSRIVALSASGMVVSGDDPLSRYLAKPLVARLLADHFADLSAMEDRLAASDARWTLIRPPRLTQRQGNGHYRSRRDGNVRWGFTITRDDLALAIVDALYDDSTIGRHLSVAA